LTSLYPIPPPSIDSGSSSVSDSDDETDVVSSALDDLQKATGMTLGTSIPDALSKAKQSRGEKKARKVGREGGKDDTVSTSRDVHSPTLHSYSLRLFSTLLSPPPLSPFLPPFFLQGDDEARPEKLSWHH